MIELIEIRNIEKLEKCIQKICPENEKWHCIAQMEKEMQIKENENIIAFEIQKDSTSIGLIQYDFKKSLFQKEKIIINLLTISTYEEDTIRQIHEYLIKKHTCKGKLIHVIQKEEEKTDIHRLLQKDGFLEKRNEPLHPKYGYEGGSLYFVKKI